MSGGPAEVHGRSNIPEGVKEIRQKMTNGGSLVNAGTYSAQPASGAGGLVGCLPAIFCQNVGVESGDDLEVYIDFENNAVVHFFGEQEE